MRNKFEFGKSLFFLLSFCFYFVLVYGTLFAQEKEEQNNCLTLEQVVGLLEKNVDQAEIIKQVKKFGVDFDLDRKATTQLVRAEAIDGLLEAIEKYTCAAPVIITSPKSGEEVGATVKVEGNSKVFEGKFLWVFAHREGLTVWWPQGGTIKVKEDGSWRQGIFLGGSQDIGFDFEIRAIWVDDNTNRNLSDYLAKGEKTGHFPGIPLPDGYPMAEIIVHKVRH